MPSQPMKTNRKTAGKPTSPVDRKGGSKTAKAAPPVKEPAKRGPGRPRKTDAPSPSGKGFSLARRVPAKAKSSQGMNLEDLTVEAVFPIIRECGIPDDFKLPQSIYPGPHARKVLYALFKGNGATHDGEEIRTLGTGNLYSARVKELTGRDTLTEEEWAVANEAIAASLAEWFQNAE